MRRSGDALERLLRRGRLFLLPGEKVGMRGALQNCPLSSFASRRSLLLVHLRLEVVLETDSLYQIELRFEPVYVLLFGFEDALENLP
jgi:hypothetical protein